MTRAEGGNWNEGRRGPNGPTAPWQWLGDKDARSLLMVRVPFLGGPGRAALEHPRVRCGGQIRCAKFLQGEIGCISLMEVTPAQPHLGVPGPFLSASHSPAPAHNTTARGQAGMGALELPRTLESQL